LIINFSSQIGAPPSSSNATLTNGSSVGSLGESDNSSIKSFETSTVVESPENELLQTPQESLADKDKSSKEKLKTHSR